MKRTIGFVAIAIASLALVCQTADARGRHHHAHPGWGTGDPRVDAAGFVVGAGSTATFLSLNHWNFRNHHHLNGWNTTGVAVATSIGCAAVSPMFATAVVHRPLTMREGHVLISGCFLPILGPILVNAAYDAHPEWDHR